MRVAPGFYRAEAAYEVVYALDCGDAYVLVDTGSAPALTEKLDQLHADGVATERIAAVLVTHCHPSHAGAVTALCAACSPLIVAHRLSVRALRHCPSATPIPEHLVSYTVDDGDAVEVGDLSFEVYHLPGHSPDSVAWHTDEHLFVGDLIRAEGGIASMDINRGACVSDYRSSLQRLLHIKAATLYPGHGAPMPLSRALVQQALDNLSEFVRAEGGELVAKGRPAARRSSDEYGMIIRLPTAARR